MNRYSISIQGADIITWDENNSPQQMGMGNLEGSPIILLYIEQGLFKVLS